MSRLHNEPLTLPETLILFRGLRGLAFPSMGNFEGFRVGLGFRVQSFGGLGIGFTFEGRHVLGYVSSSLYKP